MFNSEDEFKNIVENLNIDDTTNESHKQDLRRQMFSIFEQSTTHTAGLRQTIGRIIMKSKITKLAAAAVIIIALVIGIYELGGRLNVSSVALADVLGKMEQAQAFMYRMKMTMTGVMQPGMPAGKKEMEGTVTISNNYGMKMEMTTIDANTGQEEMNQQMYVIPDRKIMIMVMPEQKKYTRMEFDDYLLARMKKQNNDPREMIKQIMGCKYVDLGRSTIDGVEVEGFQTTDPAFSGGSMEDVRVTLWVDAENWLPVRSEMDFKMNEQMQMSGVVYDYQWDVPVDASEFEPVIPEDFTGFPAGGMKMPSMTEEAAVEGLQFFADIVGQYPKKLNLMNLMQEFSAIKDRENLTDAGLKWTEEMKQLRQETSEKALEMMRPVQSLGMFYMLLVQDRKEPAYYGESVGPNDVNMVLLRWKISDNEYRVIYGDLTAENVSAEQLSELEAALPK
jgi:outer membrane lipoprotein-sorting protein